MVGKSLLAYEPRDSSITACPIAFELDNHFSMLGTRMLANRSAPNGREPSPELHQMRRTYGSPSVGFAEASM